MNIYSKLNIYLWVILRLGYLTKEEEENTWTSVHMISNNTQSGVSTILLLFKSCKKCVFYLALPPKCFLVTLQDPFYFNVCFLSLPNRILVLTFVYISSKDPLFKNIYIYLSIHHAWAWQVVKTLNPKPIRS